MHTRPVFQTQFIGTDAQGGRTDMEMLTPSRDEVELESKVAGSL